MTFRIWYSKNRINSIINKFKIIVFTMYLLVFLEFGTILVHFRPFINAFYGVFNTLISSLN